MRFKFVVSFVAAATMSLGYLAIASPAQASGSTVLFWGTDGAARFTSPTAVTGLPQGASAIQAGNSAEYAIVDGTLYAWGVNANGELGNGTLVNELSTAVEPEIPSSSIITVGEGWSWAAAADSTGKVWGWGFNQNGVLCNPAGTNVKVPRRITNLGDTSGVKQISGGYIHSEFLFNDGTVESCGNGTKGELGDGSEANSSSPVSVAFPAGTDIVSISSGNEFTLAVDSKGNLWCWGYSAWGQCGVTKNTVTSPVEIPLEAPVAHAYAGGNGIRDGHSIVLLQDGTAWTFGSDKWGQIGNGSPRHSHPTRYHVAIPGETIVAVAASGHDTYAADSHGDLWEWGDNSLGRLGDPSITQGKVSSPTESNAVSGVFSVSGTAGMTVVQTH